MNFRTFSVVSFLSLLFTFTGFSQGAKPDQPKLVVGIVVDQMRWEYLNRFSERFGEDGFKRLLNEGFSFENCLINHLPTVTAIGHSTLYTGTVPAVHGITANDFFDQATGAPIYCVTDTSVRSVGIDPEERAGRMSPRNLQANTMTDQLRYSTNYRSKVYAISLKDRSSILPGGHSANGAFWFNGKTGRFITSTYYMESLPAWVTAYNEREMAAHYLKQDWNPVYPIETYVQSPANGGGRYETSFKGVKAPALPLKTSELMKTEGLGLVSYTPYGDKMVADMAKIAIEQEQLGMRDVPDFLALSFSATDIAGHFFSINSIFIEDHYIQLDREIGAFLRFLDEKVGKDNYLVFLSADHGATPNVQFMSDHKFNPPIWKRSYKKLLNQHLKEQFGEDELVLSLSSYQVTFNNPLIQAKQLDRELLKKSAIDFLKEQDVVAYAVDMEKAATATIPDFFKQRILNSYHSKYSGDIQLIVKPGVYSTSSRKGCQHGTSSPDDLQIPFLLMGPGVPHGTSREQVYMEDVAPTVSALLGIQRPNGCIGKPRL